MQIRAGGASRRAEETRLGKEMGLLYDSSLMADDDPYEILEDGGLFLLATHPQVIGHRSRIVILEELIQYIRSHAGVWIATHEEIARYVRATA